MTYYDGTNAPTLAVQIDLGPASVGIFTLGLSTLGGTAVLGVSTVNWVDFPITDVRAISTRRGRTREDQKDQPGVLTLTLDNWSGNYDPDKLAAAYTVSGKSMLSAGAPVRVRATMSATTISLFYGEIEYVETDVSLDPVVNITAVDSLGRLSRQQYAVATTYPTAWRASAGPIDDRFNDIFTDIGWPSGKFINYAPTSGCTVINQTVAVGDSPTTLLDPLTDTIWGRLYANKDGNIVIKDYSNLYGNSPVAYLSDVRSTSLIEYDEITTAPGARFIVNEAIYENASAPGYNQTSVDTASQGLYGRYTRTLTSALSYPNYTYGKTVTDAIISHYAFAKTRVESVGFELIGLSSATTLNFLQNVDLTSTINIARTTIDGRSLSFNCVVESLNMDISPTSWRVSLETSPST